MDTKHASAKSILGMYHGQPCYKNFQCCPAVRKVSTAARTGRAARSGRVAAHANIAPAAVSTPLMAAGNAALGTLPESTARLHMGCSSLAVDAEVPPVPFPPPLARGMTVVSTGLSTGSGTVVRPWPAAVGNSETVGSGGALAPSPSARVQCPNLHFWAR